MYFFCFFKFYLFIYLWLCWVFISARGLPPVAASGSHSSSRRVGLSPLQPLLLRSTGSRRAASAIVAHGRSRSTARGILPDQGSNLCPLHWQADSQPLRHQGSPPRQFFFFTVFLFLRLTQILFYSFSTALSLILTRSQTQCRNSLSLSLTHMHTHTQTHTHTHFLLHGLRHSYFFIRFINC